MSPVSELDRENDTEHHAKRASLCKGVPALPMAGWTDGLQGGTSGMMDRGARWANRRGQGRREATGFGMHVTDGHDRVQPAPASDNQSSARAGRHHPRMMDDWEQQS